MQITVSGKQVDLSDSLRVRVSDLHAGRGLTLRGEGEAADAHAAFDDAAEHIAIRLRRYRHRVNEHHRDLANRTPQSARQLVLRQDNEAEAAAREPANSQTAEFATIVAETAASIDKLSVSEAVMRLDLAHQPVLMFRNSSSGELNVIYRRPDGHIGWIDPTAAA